MIYSFDIQCKIRNLLENKNMEIWKEIPNYEGLYEASTHGRIRTIARRTIVIQPKRTYTLPVHQKILKPEIHRQGYLFVHLYSGHQNSKSIRIHRLVATTFLENPNNYTDVTHIDGNKENNHVENLEWCNRSQNCLHYFKIGIKTHKGDSHPQVKTNAEEVLKIRELHKKGIKPKQLMQQFGYSRPMIGAIIHRTSWKHI